LKPNTADDVFDLLDTYLTSAALGAAMELGLFWLLAERPMDGASVAEVLDVPTNRCQFWLQLLSSVGLLDQAPQGYAPSSAARAAILDTYSQETWSFVAQEARMRYPIALDLARHIRAHGSVWAELGLAPHDWYTQIAESPKRARAFTRALYEIHVPYADQLADALDMSGVERVMDLGGGSGVVPLALLGRHPNLEAVVVDIPNVCAAGREIAAETVGDSVLSERITYHEADFLEDELPSGFDMVLLCDAGPHSEGLFRKIHAVLNPDGRLVIVDHFVSAPEIAPPSCLFWAFQGSLENPSLAYTTTSEIEARLTRANYQVLSESTLPPKGVLRWSSDWVVIEAKKASQ
jgi:SAM-dependent methyltransferase